MSRGSGVDSYLGSCGDTGQGLELHLNTELKEKKGMQAFYSAIGRGSPSQGLAAMSQFLSRALYNLFVGKCEVVAWHDALDYLRIVNLEDHTLKVYLCVFLLGYLVAWTQNFTNFKIIKQLFELPYPILCKCYK